MRYLNIGKFKSLKILPQEWKTIKIVKNVALNTEY